MRKISILMIVLLLTLSFSRPALADDGDDAARKFEAELTGAGEFPARNTPASGEVEFKLSGDGTRLKFELEVEDITNVRAAHIHCGVPGMNGPVGVNLFGGNTGPGIFEGTLAEGVITAPNPGNACGWITLWDVVAAMRSGNTYVNVHTNDGLDPTNTGPGDFPGGEIRGQVESED